MWTVQRHTAETWCFLTSEHTATSYFHSINPRMEIFSSERKIAFSARVQVCKSWHPFKLFQSLHGSLDGFQVGNNPQHWKNTTVVKRDFPKSDSKILLRCFQVLKQSLVSLGVIVGLPLFLGWLGSTTVCSWPHTASPRVWQSPFVWLWGLVEHSEHMPVQGTLNIPEWPGASHEEGELRS